MKIGNVGRNGEQKQQHRLGAKDRPVGTGPARPRVPVQPVAKKPSRPLPGDTRSPTRKGTSRPARESKPKTPTPRGPQQGNRLSIGGLNISVRLLAVTLMLGIVAMVLVPNLLQWSDQRREYRAAVAQTEAAQQKLEKLQAELDNWSDPNHISAQARARLGYVDPGETQFAVVDAPQEAAQSPDEAEALEWPPKPWNIQLQEALLEVDDPPAVKEAANVPTVPLSTEDDTDE